VGLLQNIEGLFGFGKKAQQVPQDAVALTAAAEQLKTWLAQGDAVLQTLTPFGAANPTIATFVGFLKIVDEEGQTAITVIEALIPSAPTTPASPTT
jgi:hypothetical protein